MKTVFMRRAEVLEVLGVTKHELPKLEGAGVVKRYKLPGCKRGFYLRAEVEAVWKKAEVVKRE
jgi:hypothetical protein